VDLHILNELLKNWSCSKAKLRAVCFLRSSFPDVVMGDAKPSVNVQKNSSTIGML
jgi:hypothetical protein